jgi:hypothetical protein
MERCSDARVPEVPVAALLKRSVVQPERIYVNAFELGRVACNQPPYRSNASAMNHIIARPMHSADEKAIQAPADGNCVAYRRGKPLAAMMTEKMMNMGANVRGVENRHAEDIATVILAQGHDLNCSTRLGEVQGRNTLVISDCFLSNLNSLDYGLACHR